MDAHAYACSIHIPNRGQCTHAATLVSYNDSGIYTWHINKKHMYKCTEGTEYTKANYVYTLLTGEWPVSVAMYVCIASMISMLSILLYIADHL